ncbi:tRNA(Ser) Um(44) 2'-O-methyltransferase [Coniosporium apollinis]|uniref:tRNA (uracil-O(2)-)-methyltransferase n=1 Tax=Coniosporium apollinis TaxID=61459 RepID=A0ABQ9NWG4_9PEZI|nr:tRNA(Ser) Um(44) 2'-O-methyltransferase [Coniosporium apollinis]
MGHGLPDNGSDDGLFLPVDLTDYSSQFSLPDELWISVLENRCWFEAEFFWEVMLNLIRNPEISSTYLFRADIFYDSINDLSIAEERCKDHFSSSYTKHMKAEYRPIPVTVPGYVWHRTFVRQLVPRNPQRDKPLVQTCHVFAARSEASRKSDEFMKTLVLYVPHVASAEEVPWYHPAVRSLAFLHTWRSSTAPYHWSDSKISIHYSLFPDTPLDNRLQRTALSLLRLINKHGNGQKAGYTKRVHHDLIIPQARFQNKYAELKAKYAKALIGEWVEQTNPEKHVFEDLGIAAFLIELWGNMYAELPHDAKEEQENDEARAKPMFPGFVDIGCGNGALVYVLLQEGYRGWGFDARKRKTWETFPAEVQQNLKEMLLVPSIYQAGASEASAAAQVPSQGGFETDLSARLSSFNFDDPDTTDTNLGIEPGGFHNGIFPHGTFIISNHADELTPWTPLLAFLSRSPFITIPCCSHDFAGARSRARMVDAPTSTSSSTSSSQSEHSADEAPQSTITTARPSPDPKGTQTSNGAPSIAPPSASILQQPAAASQSGPTNNETQSRKPPETGSLKKPTHKQPSAYASLTSYVAYLAAELGYLPEKEMLRIPSTRNACIIGRRWKPAPAEELVDVVSLIDDGGEDAGRAQREDTIKKLVEREMGISVGQLGEEWVRRARALQGKKSNGH